MPDKKLRPRFNIQKRRIGGEKSDAPEETEFIPEQVLYIELDDEITQVFDRVKRLKGKKIAIVAPKHAVLLESVINLKILKKKTDEMKKEIILVTSDTAGRAFAEKAGIHAAARLMPESEGTAAPSAPPPPRVGARPVRQEGKKVSLSEVIREKKPGLVEGIISGWRERWKKRKQSETRLVLVTPNKQALFTLILVSVLLLLAIAYIALPGATIEITPRSSILDPTFNITFAESDRNRDFLLSPPGGTLAVASFIVDPPPIQKKITHAATGKIFQGGNSKGIIIVTNLSTTPWELAPRTRFQTENGLVFRTPAGVRVPPLRGSTPGSLEVAVIADEADANGQVVGERGNIPPSKFFLPGLKNSENKKKLYGESKLPMAGGFTQTLKIATKEDIDAAREEMKRLIFKEAADDLKAYLEQQNLVKKTNLSLLTDRNLVKINEPVITVPQDIIGKPAEQFEITASYTATGIAYDRQELIAALKTRLASRVDPDKKILKIEEDDVSYRFLDIDPRLGRARLTATMRAIQSFELDPEQENGHRFLKKITDHILGARVKDALSYLSQQTDEIASVKIKTWPVWAPTIPNIAEHVKFVIVEEE